MGWLKQETAYERKIRELEEEADRIRKNMQSIMKNVERGVPPSRGGTSVPGRATSPESADARRSYQAATVTEPDPVEQDGDFDDTPLSGGREETGTTQQVIEEDSVPAYGPARLRHNQAPKPEKLANYLASGSFGKRGSLTRERRIQRNKAIFMLIFALLAVFSLISMLK